MTLVRNELKNNDVLDNFNFLLVDFPPTYRLPIIIFSCNSNAVFNPCGGIGPMILANASTGIIVSPNFPARYPNNVECQWLIQGSDEVVIHLSFLAFDVEEK